MEKRLFLSILLCLLFSPTLSAQTGRILFERWDDAGFDNLSRMSAVERFIDFRSPNVTEYLTSFDSGEFLGDDYIGRISGWLVVATTGDYTFWVSSDDSSRVWLSSDESHKNTRLICSVDGWTGYHEWDSLPSQKSVPITLVAGESYWIEALWQEGSGSDHLALAWQGPGGDRAVIDGSFLSDAIPISWIAKEPVPASGWNVDPNHVVLQWQAGDDPPAPISRYDVYFSSEASRLGTASTKVCSVNTGDPLQCIIGQIAGGAKYFWQVDTVIDGSTHALSAVWTFNTDVESIKVCPDTGPCSVGPLVINEIHYDPHVKTELVEFVELYNVTEEVIDLSDWQFTSGIRYRFEAGSMIAPRGFVVLAQNPEAFQDKFGFPPLGPFEGRLRNRGETLSLYDANDTLIDEVDYQLGFPWPIVGDAANHSIQLISPAMDNDLGGVWRSAVVTPGAHSRVLNANAPPIMRQLSHTPTQPVAGETVAITLKVSDADGVADVTLSYQIVEPGDYFGIDDTRYETQWTDLSMVEDIAAGQDRYTALIPAEVQQHRRLIRYRITAVDRLGLAITGPYEDDPQPNFAYFVYNGVPAWTGSIRPGVEPDVTYDSSVMRSLPVYHLISKKSDVEEATWIRKDMGSTYRWKGTLVYDGQVYDHIRYRMRGGVWRYSMGKNMFKFDFLRGHRFQAHNDYGEPYKEKWDKLNFSACIQQGSFGQRGEQGMIEALTFKMFNLTGVPAPHTHWLHFRIIDEEHEDGLLNAAHSGQTTSGTQYDGDFWGLYMAIEQMDGQFLDEHDLPDGNLYKMESRYGEKNNQGETAVTDNSDIRLFKDTYETRPQVEWWRTNVRLDRYVSHVAVQHACHHGDVTGKNHFFYLNPEPYTDEWGSHSRWSLLPWDVDLTWTTYYGGMSDPFSRAGIFSRNEINIQMKNRVREVCDLLFTPEQMEQLIDEFAAIINDPNGALSMVDTDRAMWDYHWVMNAGPYLRHDPSFKAGWDRFYRAAENAGLERSFEGMIQLLKNYVVSRQNHMEGVYRDASIPDTPQISYVGSSNFAANDLVFATTAFSDSQGPAGFGAVKWRIAQVNAGSVFWSGGGGEGLPGQTLIEAEQNWRYFKGTAEPSAPGLWRLGSFNDDPASTAWLEGQTPIGYGESFINTQVADMRGSYSTLYFRKTFRVDNADTLASLRIRIKYDDGFNAWINGTRVAFANVDGAELPFNATSRGTSNENHGFVDFVSSDLDFLRPGENVLAVQVLNVYLGNSSDCFFDAELIGIPVDDRDTPDAPAPQHLHRGPGHYEIETLWESDADPNFSETVTIPAGVVKPGLTYRVRCRMMDNTDRWSHWSDPVQFEVNEPMASGILQDLRITELMYNPADPPPGSTYDNDEFEYVELKNIGDEIIEDLSSVSFADGFRFDFADSAIQHLAPGEFVLVVRNRAAFIERYGMELNGRIAGEYAPQNLSNGGERVILEDYWNGIIADFRYNDSQGWPQRADGDGFSLVPLDSALVDQPQGSLNDMDNWRASSQLHGSPGADDATP